MKFFKWRAFWISEERQVRSETEDQIQRWLRCFNTIENYCLMLRDDNVALTVKQVGKVVTRINRRGWNLHMYMGLNLTSKGLMRDVALLG